MKLKTSYFNLSVLKKDITRFAPLWGLYAVYMALYLMTQNYQSPARFASEINSLLWATGGLNVGYAGLAALLLFGDLFKTRLCGALHAMPLRREGWFLTHTVSALLFCIVPNLLGAVIGALMLDAYSYLAWVWFAVSVLQFICFFGIAVFSVQCAGTGLGATAMYGIINFLPVLVLWLIKCFYEPLLHGVYFREDTVFRFSPALHFAELDYVDIFYTYKTDTLIFKGFSGDAFLYSGIAAAAGIGLLVAAIFIYRKRQLERAGDFIAFRPAAPVFLVFYALCVGAVFYTIGLLGASLVPLLLGLAIGWFTGWMLLEKRVKVFRKKTFCGFGILLAAFLLTIGITFLDPLGITRYVPQPEQVKQVQVSPYTSDYYYNRTSAVITDPAQVEKLTQIHRDLSRTRGENPDNMVLCLRYTLKNGKTVERQYRLAVDSEHGQWLKNIYSRPETVLGSGDLHALKQSIRFAEVYKYNEKYTNQPERLTWECDPQDYDALLDALMADCQERNMTQLDEYRREQENVAVLQLQFGQEYRDVVIYPDCRNTVAFLQAHWPQDQ